MAVLAARPVRAILVWLSCPGCPVWHLCPCSLS
jgi:hypothetical protein